MSLVGLELNSTRARAVLGPGEVPPRSLALDGKGGDLPMALSLENRRPEVGRPGLALCRRLPHLTCIDFLADLGERRQWGEGRKRIDADKALALVLEHLRPAVKGVKGLVATLPAYLSRAQADLVTKLAEKTKLPWLGSVSAPLAVGLAAHAEHPWEGRALVLDVDDHALSWSAVELGPERIFVVGEQNVPSLGLLVWKRRLLDALADRCIRHSRRDPRDSGQAEQALFDRLDSVLDAASQNQTAEVEVRAATWFQDLVLRPDEIIQFCSPLVRQTLKELTQAPDSGQEGKATWILLTEATGHLPGLVPALQEGSDANVEVSVLPPNALARAAHDLAVRISRDEMPRAHLDATVSLVSRAPQPDTRTTKKRRISIFGE
jgi:molecular chaperone DnaK (HSP70)